MSPDKYLIILYNRTRLGPFRVFLLSVTCQLIKTGFYIIFLLFFFLPSLSNLVIIKASLRIESISRCCVYVEMYRKKK